MLFIPQVVYFGAYSRVALETVNSMNVMFGIWLAFVLLLIAYKYKYMAKNVKFSRIFTTFSRESVKELDGIKSKVKI
jgi:hypothetical protein